jgi:imidazole glycerol-phosphate synthase subunit HisH
MTQIGVINYGSGNFGSVWNALEFLNLRPKEITEPQHFRLSTHVVLPGVGAFGACMRRLDELGLVDSLLSVPSSGKPILGICVGMQVLATRGVEFGSHDGLGLIPGITRPININPSSSLRLPHVGWNSCKIRRVSGLTDDLATAPDFYFVHSNHLVPDDARHIVATCEHEEQVAAIVQKDNIYGVQFHPEKSQQSGLALLSSFARL